MYNLVWLFIIGTIVGSFLNVCIHRFPHDESIIWPASHCPKCQRRLGFFDLIPIISFFFLRGRCRYCQAKISPRYPLVEFLTGCLFVLAGLNFSLLSLEFGFAILLGCLLLVISFIDFEHMVIPDALCVVGMLAGLGFNYLKSISLTQPVVLNPFFSAMLGLAVGFIFLYLIGLLGKLCFKKDAMGEGDLYLGALLGAFLGWQGVILAIFLAYFIAGIIAILLLMLRKLQFGDYVPFGPALALGGFLTFFYGQQMLYWYIDLVVMR